MRYSLNYFTRSTEGCQAVILDDYIEDKGLDVTRDLGSFVENYKSNVTGRTYPLCANFTGCWSTQTCSKIPVLSNQSIFEKAQPIHSPGTAK